MGFSTICFPYLKTLVFILFFTISEVLTHALRPVLCFYPSLVSGQRSPRQIFPLEVSSWSLLIGKWHKPRLPSLSPVLLKRTALTTPVFLKLLGILIPLSAPHQGKDRYLICEGNTLFHATGRAGASSHQSILMAF